MKALIITSLIILVAIECPWVFEVIGLCALAVLWAITAFIIDFPIIAILIVICLILIAANK